MSYKLSDLLKMCPELEELKDYIGSALVRNYCPALNGGDYKKRLEEGINVARNAEEGALDNIINTLLGDRMHVGDELRVKLSDFEQDVRFKRVAIMGLWTCRSVYIGSKGDNKGRIQVGDEPVYKDHNYMPPVTLGDIHQIDDSKILNNDSSNEQNNTKTITTNAITINIGKNEDEVAARVNYALYLNGVYESVLEEIRETQDKNPGMVCYLQPYASDPIAKLAADPPTAASPITLYTSTTSALSVVSYRAKVVGWENKNDIEKSRLSQLNNHISEYQPGETEIYMTTGEEKPCVNLISILELEKLPTLIPVSSFTKVSDDSPLKARTTSGRWSYVKPLPEWVGAIPKCVVKDELDAEYQSAVQNSLELAEEERTKRLLNAPKLPESIQIISRGYRRNYDVVAAVLIRANGKCERCKCDAPFISASKGAPYLEVHHKVMLSKNGEDTVENAVALCPNCHRYLHYGI